MDIDFKPKDALVTFDDKTVTDEQCGILFGVRSDDRFVVEQMAVVKNTAQDPHRDFSMKAGDVRKATERLGLTEADIIGAIHTHPPGSRRDPSWQDIENQPPLTLGVVYHVSTKTLSYYTHEDGWIGKESL